MGMANPAQHTDEHQDDMARILCERCCRVVVSFVLLPVMIVLNPALIAFALCTLLSGLAP